MLFVALVALIALIVPAATGLINEGGYEVCGADCACQAPFIHRVPRGSEKPVITYGAGQAPLNEACYAADTCTGYVSCCVTKDTCISVHGGLVSSNADLYEGGCYSDQSSRGSFNTAAGCTGVGECDEHYLRVNHGVTTTASSPTMITPTSTIAARLSAHDWCGCPESYMLDVSKGCACVCDPEYAVSSWVRGARTMVVNASRCLEVDDLLNPRGCPKKKLSTEAIIGISVGSVVALALAVVVFVAFCCMSKSKKKASTVKQMPPPETNVA